MGLVDYLILAGVVLLAAFAVRYSIRHKNSCCGDCSHCHDCEACERDRQKKK